MFLRKPSSTSLIAYIFFGLALAMGAGSIYAVMSIDVLTNWKLILPGTSFTAGETIIIRSEYTKLRQVTGTATRYIDCDTPDGARLSYLLNQKEANRTAGSSKGTAVEITLPTNISNLPTKCDIRIVVKYKVVPFKDTTEINQTKDFELLPNPSAGSSTVLPSTTQTSPSQSPAVSVPLSVGNSQSSSLSNNTATANPPQSNTPQGSSDTPQPGVVSQVVQGAGALLNTITRGVL